VKALEVERFWTQQLAARGIGMDPRQARVAGGQARLSGLEEDILNLPVDTSHWGPMQDAAGDFYFILGISPLGVDPLA
jgi:hypothetical protein